MKTFEQAYEESVADYLKWCSDNEGNVGIDQAVEKLKSITIEKFTQLTTEAIKEHLSRAAENAKIRPIPYYRGPGEAFEVDRESITNIEVILP